MPGQCGIRSLQFFVGKQVIIRDTAASRKLCLVNKRGQIESADDKKKKIFVICWDEIFGVSGPFGLSIDDVEIQ
ncbi:hypothetical protein KKG29_04900 [Patescibacteria group bacterium]|nr:hypothetical protein [Patescibacteria group bacterium]MBU4000474.1 hypothetical protein [Patescibacteria group bacterium]MBU4057125.1 hypothetical protein [Patescibacteria group bacterium]MBU4368889.1 hypothetical protein [Patescibacteria group bacterium]